MTPRTRRLGTRSIPGSGGGSTPFRRAENMISLVFSRFSLRLLAAAHACRCAISSLHVCVASPGTTRYVSSANLKILLWKLNSKNSQYALNYYSVHPASGDRDSTSMIEVAIGVLASHCDHATAACVRITTTNIQPLEIWPV